MSEQEAWLKGIETDEKEIKMTKEEFMEIFIENIEVMYDISQRLKALEDHRLAVLHMLTEIELEDRGLLK